MDILPSDCWSLIFSHLTKLSDIFSNGSVCKDFHSLVNKAIEIIDDNESRYKIMFNILDKWPRLHTINLRDCYIDLIDPLMSIKTIEIYSTGVRVFRFWEKYWMNPDRTQEEFASISHRIGYFSIINGREMRFRCDKGVIINPDLRTSYVRDLIIELTEKYLVKFCSTDNGYELSRISRNLQSNNIGIKLTSNANGMNPFYLVYKNSNIVHIEMEFDDLYIQGYQMYSYLNEIPICDREFSMKIPIYSGCLDLFHTKFPKVKSITVIVTNTDEIPQIPGVEIKGYDQIRRCYI